MPSQLAWTQEPGHSPPLSSDSGSAMHQLRNIDLNLLVIFQVIFEERNLGKACKKIHLSQPAISHSLARLRASLNDPLFVRTKSGMIPTHFSRQIYPYILKSMRIIQDQVLPDKKSFSPISSEKTFHLALGEYGEHLVLPVLLKYIRKEAPGVSIRLKPGYGTDLTEELRDQNLDIALDWLPFEENTCYSKESILEDSIVAIARRHHPKISGKLSADQFKKIPHVGFRPRASSVPPIEKAFRNSGIERHIALEVNQLSVIPNVISESDYIGILPYYFAKKLSDPEKIQIFKLPFANIKGMVYMIWHRKNESNPGHEWLRSGIKICGKHITQP